MHAGTVSCVILQTSAVQVQLQAIMLMQWPQLLQQQSHTDISPMHIPQAHACSPGGFSQHHVATILQKIGWRLARVQRHSKISAPLYWLHDTAVFVPVRALPFNLP